MNTEQNYGLPLEVRFRDQGLGHGHYGVIDATGKVVVPNESKDFAAFIVLACNSHQALVEACKAALQLGAPIGKCYGTEDVSPAAVFDQLRAALALADPEPAMPVGHACSMSPEAAATTFKVNVINDTEPPADLGDQCRILAEQAYAQAHADAIDLGLSLGRVTPEDPAES